jgi:hypothetical protein
MPTYRGRWSLPLQPAIKIGPAATDKPKKLLDRVRDALRVKGFLPL